MYYCYFELRSNSGVEFHFLKYFLCVVADLGGAVYFGLGVACVGFNSCNIHSNQAIGGSCAPVFPVLHIFCYWYVYSCVSSDGGGVYINATADLTVPLIDSVLRNNTAQNGTAKYFCV